MIRRKNYEQQTARKWSTDRSADFHRTCLQFCHGPLPRFAQWAGSIGQLFRAKIKPSDARII